MDFSPKKIYDDFINNKADKPTVIDHLISIIEDSELIRVRFEAIIILGQIGPFEDRIFNLLENLLISDSHEIIRNAAASVLRTKFLSRTYEPVKWAFNNEVSINPLITITDTLGHIS
ncbi:MAG: HEAT repeat domain-containing protein, partial [Promethearchaeota archaeon]